MCNWMGDKWENDWEWPLTGSFPVSIRLEKRVRMAPVRAGKEVRQFRRNWFIFAGGNQTEVGNQECGEPRERSRDRYLEGS
jgi:hypothetical protein